MRLDVYLVQQNLVESRSKAAHLIKQELVLVNGNPISKAHYNVKEKDLVELKQDFQYVSRGGYKIAGFNTQIQLVIQDKTVLDLGCSVGGFSDFFLQNGAQAVVAVDIAAGILDQKIRNDPKVRFFEYIDVKQQSQLKKILGDTKFDIISIDITNVPIRDVLPNVLNFITPESKIIVLFKPQYESHSESLKGQHSDQVVESLLKEFENWVQDQFIIKEKAPCSIKGGAKGKGNQEFLFLLQLKTN